MMRFAGENAGPSLDSEYNSFLQELGGGGPPRGGFPGAGPPGGGGGSHLGGPGLGAPGFKGGPRGRPGDELSDDCKLFVGSLSPAITDAVLRAMFEAFGTVSRCSTSECQKTDRANVRSAAQAAVVAVSARVLMMAPAKTLVTVSS